MTTPILDTGYRPSPVDHGDHLYKATGLFRRRTPTSFDVLRNPLPFRDQGQKPKCLACAIATAAQVDARADQFQTLAFDDDELYDAIKLPEGGAYPRAGLDRAYKVGVWSPTTNRYHRIASYSGVDPRDHAAVRNALWRSRGLLVGFAVTLAWAQGGGREFRAAVGAAKAAGAGPDDIIGYHAMFASGFDPLRFWGPNSWGEDWSTDGVGEWDLAYWHKHVFEVWQTTDADD